MAQQSKNAYQFLTSVCYCGMYNGLFLRDYLRDTCAIILSKDRPAYYRAINVGENYEKRKTDITPWLEYFVKGFKEEIDNVKTKVTSLSLRKVDDKLHFQIYLNKDQMKILEFLDQMGKITVKDVVNILECPKRTAQAYLQRLKTLKIIKQVGKGPASAYVLA